LTLKNADSLFLRLIVACHGDQAMARQIEASVLPLLAPWSPRRSKDPCPYWKLPGHFELSFALQPATAAAHLAISALEPNGWDTRLADADASCVWNPTAGSAFLHPTVVWAELGFL
jgi:hypothetical protein